MKQIFYKISIVTTALIIAINSTSCDDFTEVERPSGQLTRPVVFEDPATADAALLYVYARMRDWGMLTGTNQSTTTKLGMYADEFSFYGSASSATVPFYNNALTPTDATLASWWKEAYNQVYAANSVIEGVAASTALSQADKDRLTGEALFIRAHLHIQLTMLFGDIPFVDSTDYRVNTTIGKTSSAAVLALAITDLQQASQKLAEAYTTSERTRPNKSAAIALMARAYLYAGEWAAAADAASQVINNTALYNWEDDLDNVFKKEAITTIWQYHPALPGRNSAEGATFVLVSGPPAEVALSAELLAAFEPGDLRSQHWVGSVSAGGDTWYYPFKYKERTITPSSVEYSIQLRLAEQYLIRAEARAQQGELISAKEDLDQIRSHAGLPQTTATSQADILDAIITERRVELFAESGHRFFDLKRTGRLDQVLQVTKPGWNTEDAYMPIPDNELQLNPNMAPQNPGY
jgi:starch-binding outer membrane protein, SusD/RagB family